MLTVLISKDIKLIERTKKKLFFGIFFSLKNSKQNKEMYHSFHKNIKQHNFNIFYIYYRNKYLFSTKSLTLLLKDHMTLKTGVMAAEKLTIKIP